NSSWPIFVTGQYQIAFHLTQTFNWFLGTLVASVGQLFDSQYVLQNGGFGTAASFNTYFNQHPIPGTGPYVVTDFQVNAFVKFAQNPQYWGRNLTSAEIAANPAIDPGRVKNVDLFYK